MISWSEIAREVVRRAADRCEYCKMHQSLQGATFHVEHIIPLAIGGISQLKNLALACPSCNLHKSDRVAAKGIDGQEEIPLFNPRIDVWEQHFQWDEYDLIGLTAIGIATIHLLRLNDGRKIRIRQAEASFGLFPPNQFLSPN